ncbi:MAG: BatD family protein [Bacteroidetes bacterium]|nr:BatD family protein [Bacteroidota bacterium]
MKQRNHLHIKKINGLLIGLCLLWASAARAQKLVAQVSKNKVVTGEVFQITFSANGSMGNFTKPSLSDFDIYSGPNQSTSMQFANGIVSQSVSYSYMIAARKEGHFTIGAASAVVNGAEAKSNPIAIEVSKGDPNQQKQQQRQQQQSNPFGGFFEEEDQQPQQQKNIGNQDLFVRTYVNKKQCYIGEQITVSQKIYAKNGITHRGMQNGKFPSYEGFWSKTEEQKGPLPINTETIDGVPYGVVELNHTYLFPQRTGKLTIDPIELDWIVHTQSRKQQSIFDQFFGGGGQDVVVKLKSKPLIIDVQALPEKGKPESFTGAVGAFSFNAKVSRDRVKANESVSLKLSLSGKGNISLASAPKINFPEGFETYEPKVNESISTQGGVSGSKTYEYLLIPRKEGTYNLNNISFSYFDVEKKQYVTLSAPEIKITVDAADPNAVAQAQVYSPKNEIQSEENDIRYIKTGSLNLQNADETFFSSWKHYGILTLIIFSFITFVIGRNRYLKTQVDVVGMKQKRALKKAKKQLALAEKFKNENKQDAFYNEVLTALNKYISDKLNIPVADLSKENISEHLMQKQVHADMIKQLVNALNDCEYARYAPAAAEKDLGLVYNNTLALIISIEAQLTQKSKTHLAAFFVCLFFAFSAFSANEVDSAAMAYHKKEFKKAISYYETVVKEGKVSAALHYNLGNAYYKNNQLGEAIYHYELAQKLNPSDKDITNNLMLANTKVIDKIENKENFFVNTIKSELYSMVSITGWAYATILCLLFAALLFVLFIVTENKMLKRLGFWGGLTLLVAFVCSFVIGTAALHQLNKKTQAIILTADAPVLSEPHAESKIKFTLHEGTKVNVLNTEADYTAIQLANGNEGFVATRALGLF